MLWAAITTKEPIQSDNRLPFQVWSLFPATARCDVLVEVITKATDIKGVFSVICTKQKVRLISSILSILNPHGS